MQISRFIIAATTGTLLFACGLSVLGTGSLEDPGADGNAGHDGSANEAGLYPDGGGPIGDGGLGECAPGDLASDPQNCGACGHDCLGGACENGLCQPFRVSFLDASAASIAAMDSGVYWVVPGGTQVMACPPSGCATQPIPLAGGLNDTVALVALDGELAVLDNADLQAVTTAGAAVAIYPFGTTTLEQGAIICTDGSGYAYFLTETNSQKFVGQILIDGGNVNALISNDNNLDAIGCGAGHVAWEVVPSGTPTIYSCEDPSSDCTTPATINPGTGVVETHIVANASQVFFTRRAPGTVNTCPVEGCSEPSILYTGTDLNGVAVDDTYVYFTSFSGGIVARCAPEGCGASYVALATKQYNPHALIITDTAIYWATDAIAGSGGDAGTPAAIYRLAK